MAHFLRQMSHTVNNLEQVFGGVGVGNPNNMFHVNEDVEPDDDVALVIEAPEIIPPAADPQLEMERAPAVAICAICQVRNATHLFACGHLCVCDPCAEDLCNRGKDNICVRCRQPSRNGLIRLHF